MEHEQDDYQRHVDDAYRAIGRYMYEFSRLVYHMRSAISRHLSPTAVQVVDIVIGEMAARSIADGLFGLIENTVSLDKQEQEVSRTLRKEILKVIESRNNIAHGDWHIGWGSAGASEPEPPSLLRIKSIRRDGGPWSERTYTPQDLHQQSDDVAALRNLVGEFAALTIGSLATVHRYRVGDILVVQNGLVHRAGPQVGQSSANYP